jgi:flagellar protein FlaG
MEIQQLSAPVAVARPLPAQSDTLPAVPGAVVSVAAPTPAPKPEQVKEAAQEIQKFVSNVTTNLQFSVDQDTGRTVVSVVDAETKQIVRQIPAEHVMKIARALDRMQGILFSGRA